MSEHVIDGKTVKHGDIVEYTYDDGTKHQAVVKNLEAVFRADLETTTIGGNTTRFWSAVPYNEGALGSFRPLSQPEKPAKADEPPKQPDGSGENTPEKDPKGKK